MTTLFIGNLYKYMTQSKLEESFKLYGDCKVELKSRQEAELAMKNLNNTNLQGANSTFKVRIEFSHKTKIGDRLGPNFHKSYFSEYQTGPIQNFNDDQYYNRKVEEKEEEQNNLITINRAVIEGQNELKPFCQDQTGDQNPFPISNKSENKKELDKEKHQFDDKSSDKMQIDSELTKDDLRDFRENEETKNKNHNSGFSRECKYNQNQPHFSKEKNYEKEERYKRNFDPYETELQKMNICFICKLPGHFARDCILTKEFCYECGFKGHIARECDANVRNAKVLTENRVKALLTQQMTYKYILPGDKIRNLVNYYKKIQ